MTVHDWRRPLDAASAGYLCAVVAVNDRGSTVTACRCRWPYASTRVVVDPSLTIDSPDACGGCVRELRQSRSVTPSSPTSMPAFVGQTMTSDEEQRCAQVAARRLLGQHCQVEIGICRGFSFCRCHCESCHQVNAEMASIKAALPLTQVDCDAANLAAMRGMVVIGDMPSLVDHELEQLQRLAAPAMPRTTAVDLPYDVSDCGTPDIGDVDWSQGSEAKS